MTMEGIQENLRKDTVTRPHPHGLKMANESLSSQIGPGLPKFTSWHRMAPMYSVSLLKEVIIPTLPGHPKESRSLFAEGGKGVFIFLPLEAMDQGFED